MSEMEVPLEQSQEDLHHHASHSGEKWITWVALTSALIAVMAALTVMKASRHADEGMLAAGEKNDRWAQFQAKSIKAGQMETRIAILKAMDKPVLPEYEKKLKDYAHDQQEISAEAKKLETESKHHLEVHDVMAFGVTLFQVSIAVAAIAALSKQRAFWYVSLMFGAVGTFFAVQGMLMKPKEGEHAEPKPHAALILPADLVTQLPRS